MASKVTNPELKLVEAKCQVGPITTREVNYTEKSGNVATIRVAMSLTVDPKELSHLPEGKALQALAKCGDGVDKDQKHTTSIRMRRSWAGHVFTITDPDAGGPLEFRGTFKAACPKFVHGDIELRIDVDAALPLGDVAKLQALMVSPTVCSTTAVQGDLLNSAVDADAKPDKEAQKPMKRQSKTRAQANADAQAAPAP